MCIKCTIISLMCAKLNAKKIIGFAFIDAFSSIQIFSANVYNSHVTIDKDRIKYAERDFSRAYFVQRVCDATATKRRNERVCRWKSFHCCVWTIFRLYSLHSPHRFSFFFSLFSSHARYVHISTLFFGIKIRRKAFIFFSVYKNTDNNKWFSHFCSFIPEQQPQ